MRCSASGKLWISPISSAQSHEPMKASTLAVSAAVAVVCAALLVLFTDIDVSIVRWFSCGPLSTHREDQSELCHRKF